MILTFDSYSGNPLVRHLEFKDLVTLNKHPSYDYLADTYASHVNHIFWKLHGWIDERIRDWIKTHEITGGCSMECPLG